MPDKRIRTLKESTPTRTIAGGRIKNQAARKGGGKR